MSLIDKNAVSRIMEVADDLKVDGITYTLANPKNKDEVVAVINIKVELTVDEKAAFVDRVVNGVFDSDGDYMPWLFDPLFMITLIQMTTNVPVFKRKITNEATGEKINVVDVEKTYALAKAMNLRGVNNGAYQNLINELQGLIADKLEYRKRMNMSQERQMLSKAREELETGVAMVSAVADKLNGTLANMGNISDLADAVKNVDYDALSRAVLAPA